MDVYNRAAVLPMSRSLLR